MRVEIQDWNGQLHIITSRDARIVGDWAAEQFRDLITADVRLQECRMSIWPQDHAEMEAIGKRLEYVALTQDGLLHLADVILQASKMLGAREESRAGHAHAG